MYFLQLSGEDFILSFIIISIFIICNIINYNIVFIMRPGAEDLGRGTSGVHTEAGRYVP